MELRDALTQILEIRQQMARGQVSRGYHSATVATVGVLGIAGAVAQPYLIPAPVERLEAYLALWTGIAAVAFLLAAIGLWRRSRRSSLERQSALQSADRLLPAIGVGAATTLSIYLAAPDAAPLLPGLWSLFFSLGVFALVRQLPRPAFWVGVYFAMCGIAGLVGGQGAYALSPWLMGVPFGGGMLISAAILHWTLEQEYDTEA